MKLALLALALAACQSSPSSPSPSPSPSPKKGQMVTAITDDWSSTKATLRLWERDGGKWHALGEPWQGVVGGKGLVRDRDKKEGDGKSPAGIFPLRSVYGYAAKPPAGTKLPYTQVDDNWKCIDDPHSQGYAQIVDRRTVPPDAIDWKSAEDMKRPDELYTWVIDTGYNNLRAPAHGSCIFLHVWHGPDSTTVGCTAMAEPDLAHLVAALDPTESPLFVLLPQSEYRAQQAAWGLPAQ